MESYVEVFTGKGFGEVLANSFAVEFSSDELFMGNYGMLKAR